MVQTPKPHPEREEVCQSGSRVRWPLFLLFVFLGLIGGAIGGEVGPVAVEGGRFPFPPRFIVLFAGFGALVGILPGVLGAILVAILGKVLSDRGTSVVMRSMVAAAVFCASAMSAAVVLGYLYLASFSAC